MKPSRRMKKIGVIWLIILSVQLIQSCRILEMVISDINITMVEIEEIQRKDWKQTEYHCTSLLKEQLAFVISYDLTLLEEAAVVGFGNTAYATSVGKVIVNPLLDEAFELRFSEPVVFNGKTISPNTDVLAIQEIKRHVKIYDASSYRSCHGSINKVIEFDDYFMEQCDFKAMEYTAIITCKTSDGKVFERPITFTTFIE